MTQQQPIMPSVIAHRGASGDAPENTLAAIELAASQGAKWVEIDINLSRDAVPVLHHDDSLERCSNGHGLVIEHTLEQLKQLDCGLWFSTEFQGETIATLQECLDLCNRLGLGINLEIKPTSGHEVATASRIIDHLQTCKMLPPLVLSSFSHLALQTVAQREAAFSLASLFVVAAPDWQSLADEIGAINLHLHANSMLQRDCIDNIHQSGRRVYCYTVNEESRAQALLQMGVNGVITNYPGKILQAVNG